MKFDVVRAWKDEAYRQSLSQEQLSTLPANPVGELSEAELASVSGRGGWGGGSGAAGASSSSAASQEDIHVHSFSFECDINCFSWNTLWLGAIISIATLNRQACLGSD